MDDISMMMMDDESIRSSGLKKGPWTAEEDRVLVEYIEKNGHGSWRALPKLAGLNRCGKSCRLRWTNYLRPDIKRGNFTHQEQNTIINLHALLGNKWSTIAGHLPGRTDNEIKNFWNTHLKKKLLEMGLDPVTHRPAARSHNNHLIHLLLSNLQHLLAAATATATATNHNHIASASASFATTNPLSNWDLRNIRINDNTNNSDALSLALQQQHNTLIQALDLDLDTLLLMMNPSTTHHLLHQLATPQNNSNPPQAAAVYPINISHQLNLDHHHPPCNNFTNFEPPNIHHQLQLQPTTHHHYVHKMPTPYYYNNHCFDSDPPPPPSSSLPNLVSPSPHECSSSPPSLKKMKTTLNPNDQDSNHISNNNNPSSSSNSTTFEMWADFMGEGHQASPAYWKHLIDQECNQPWSIS